MLIYQLFVLLIDKTLKTWIHIQVLQHTCIDPIDRYFLGLSKMNTLSHYFPSTSVIQICRRGINIHIIQEYAIPWIIASELFINSFS